MTKFFRLFSRTLFAIVFLFGAVAHAGEAQTHLEGKQKELTALIKQPASSANTAKLTVTFDALLDYAAFATNSLGSEWANLNDAQRKEFQSLLTTLVQRSYTKNIRNTLDYNIIFQSESNAKDGNLVQTQAKHKTDPRKEKIQIDYLVHKVGGGWRVYDIITEGESLVGNYQSQFRRVIKKDGFSGLMDRMRAKAKED